jgi:hypothetical protein
MAFFLMFCVSCNENYHLNLDGATATDASLSLPSAVLGQTPMVGTCFPDGSTVTISSEDFDTSTPGPFSCPCEAGKFDCGMVNIPGTGPNGENPKIDVSIKDQNGNTNTNEATAPVPEVDLVHTIDLEVGQPTTLSGVCNVEGADIELTSPDMAPSPVSCTCANNAFNCGPVIFSGTGPNSAMPVVNTLMTDPVTNISVTDQDTLNVNLFVELNPNFTFTPSSSAQTLPANMGACAPSGAMVSLEASPATSMLTSPVACTCNAGAIDCSAVSVVINSTDFTLTPTISNGGSSVGGSAASADVPASISINSIGGPFQTDDPIAVTGTCSVPGSGISIVLPANIGLSSGSSPVACTCSPFGTFDFSSSECGSVTLTANTTGSSLSITATITDTDGDTTNDSDSIEIIDRDTDGDGIPDATDVDDDNDGILDTKECPTTDLTSGVGSFESIAGTQGGGNHRVGSLSGFSHSIGSADILLTPNLTVAAGGGTGWAAGFGNGVNASPDGDNFVVAYYFTTGNREGFNYSLTSLNVGSNYTIEFYQTYAGVEGNVPTNPIPVGELGRWKITTPSGINFTPELDFKGIDNQVWEKVSLSFTANAASHDITFEADPGTDGITVGTYGDVIGIDGLVIYESTGSCETESDGDAIVNRNDLDSDNDGMSDLTESGFSYVSADSNSDGLISGAESLTWLQDNINGSITDGDANNDGLMDIYDVAYNTLLLGGTFGTDAINSDSDIARNFLDLDSDGDTIPDATEARASGDYVAYPATIDDTADSDDDGILDIYDDSLVFGSTDTLFKTGINSPNADDDDSTDFIPDYLDLDSDEDGINDQTEAGTISTVPTYADPDGSVNNPIGTSDGLTVSDIGATEPDFRNVVKVALNNPGNVFLGKAAEFTGTCSSSGSADGDVTLTIAGVTPSVLTCPCSSGTFTCPSTTYDTLPDVLEFDVAYKSASGDEMGYGSCPPYTPPTNSGKESWYKAHNSGGNVANSYTGSGNYKQGNDSIGLPKRGGGPWVRTFPAARAFYNMLDEHDTKKKELTSSGVMVNLPACQDGVLFEAGDTLGLKWNSLGVGRYAVHFKLGTDPSNAPFVWQQRSWNYAAKTHTRNVVIAGDITNFYSRMYTVDDVDSADMYLQFRINGGAYKNIPRAWISPTNTDASLSIAGLVSPKALDDSMSGAVDTILDSSVLDNDADDSAIIAASLEILENADAGTEGICSVVGSLVRFTPVGGYTGTTSCTYKICDDDTVCDTAKVSFTYQ